MRIFFTGGAGRAGRHVVPHLIDQGHRVVNVDLTPLRHPGVANVAADIMDSGQIFNLMTSHAQFAEVSEGPPQKYDAVVHFAGIAGLHLRTENETYRINVMGTYNVIEAAVKLGIRKIIIASSETAYGLAYITGAGDPKAFPLEEDCETSPMDSYGLSKVVNEATAKAFQLRSGFDIYALRIGNVIEPHEYDRFPGFFADPGSRRHLAFSYVDARDLGQIVDLALRNDGLGYQVFNACNDTNSVRQTNEELLQRFFPNVPLTRPLSEHESLLSNHKVRDVLGFKEQHNWRNYVEDPK